MAHHDGVERPPGMSQGSRADRPSPILIEGARPSLPCEEERGAVHPPWCPAGPEVEKQHVQVTRTPNL